MTILQYLKKNKIAFDCEWKPGFPSYRWADIIVEFKNEETLTGFDSTSFDIEYFVEQNWEHDLSDLFTEFCKENDLPRNTVTNIYIRAIAETYDELVAKTA